MSNDFQEMLVEMDDSKHLTKAKEKWMLMNYKEGSRLHIQGRRTVTSGVLPYLSHILKCPYSFYG